MVKITYVQHDGTEHVVEATEGLSLMSNAVDNEVPGIDADCGGGCACATCHVFIPEQWQSLTGEQNDMESAMLQLAEGVQDNSRLACQVDVNGDMDGMVIHMPESQH